MTATRLFRSAALPSLLLAAAVSGCKKGDANAAQPETPPVMVGVENIYVAEKRTLQSGPLLSGSLTAEKTATVRAEIVGSVVQVNVEEGQRVTRGTLLGRINDDAVQETVTAAQSGIRMATEALVVAKRNAERSEKLAKAGAVADQALEQARWQVTSSEAAMADAQSRLIAAQRQLAHTRVVAPLSGIVSERSVHTGDVVQVGNPMFTVVDPGSLRLEGQVPVSALGSVTIGTPVPFTIDGYGDRRFEGKIVRINPAVDPATRQVRVTVALPNESGKLVAGLFAQGRAAVESRTAVVVPTSAIDRRGIRPTVTRLHSGVVERIEVGIGIEDLAIDRVEITEGVATGDTLIIGSARAIPPGTKVRPAASAERNVNTSN
ncbi:MAG: efflux RND transporter periplasmic adaptor subunit [Gemmatimonadota bacterium]